MSAPPQPAPHTTDADMAAFVQSLICTESLDGVMTMLIAEEEARAAAADQCVPAPPTDAELRAEAESWRRAEILDWLAPA